MDLLLPISLLSDTWSPFGSVDEVE